jgi:hypothetical protein
MKLLERSAENHNLWSGEGPEMPNLQDMIPAFEKSVGRVMERQLGGMEWVK